MNKKRIKKRIIRRQSLIPGVDGLLALRTIRLLKPLRTISNNKNMRVLVETLLASIPNLIDVFALWTFVFFVFAIIGRAPQEVQG